MASGQLCDSIIAEFVFSLCKHSKLMETVVFIFFILLAVYLTAGLLFALVFIFKGIEKVDETANSSSWGFRIIIIPGIAGLWPLLLYKWMKVKSVNHDKATA